MGSVVRVVRSGVSGGVRVRGFTGATSAAGAATDAEAASAAALAAATTAQLAAVSVYPTVSNQTGATRIPGDLIICDPTQDSVAVANIKTRDRHPALVKIGGANGADITIATTGRHLVKVLTATAVAPGDRLVASSVSGFADVDNDARASAVLLGTARTFKGIGVPGMVAVDLGIGSGGERKRLDFVDDFGANPNKNGTFVTCDQQWQDFLDSIETGVYGEKGAVIVLPDGHYYFDDHMHFTCAINAVGHGGGGAGQSTTFLHFAAGKGVRFDPFDAEPRDSSGAMLERVRVYCTKPSTWVDGLHGVVINAPVYASFVQVFNAGGNGFHVESGLVTSNANDWRLFMCSAISVGMGDRPDFNSGNGLWVKGGDTNAGGTFGFRAFNALESCIHDESFLGNTHEGAHAEACQRGYRTGTLGTSRVAFLGCYAECPLPDLVYAPSVQVGGINEGGLGDSNGIVLNDSGFSTAFQCKWRGIGVTGLKSGIMQVGSVGGAPVIVGVKPEDETYGYLNWMNEYSKRGWLELNYNLGGGNTSAKVSLDLAQEPFWPAEIRALAPSGFGGNRAGFDNGMYFGPNWWDFGAAAPSTGGWKKGDRRWATADAVIGAGKQGWVCTHSGQFGTYSEGRTATSNGTQVITLNSTSSVLKMGHVITVHSVTANIFSIVGTTVTLVDEDKGGGTRNVGAGGPWTIAFSPPTFVEF